MPLEIEAKLKVSEDEARHVLSILSSKCNPVVHCFEQNTYLDTKEGKLDKSGHSLRLRSATQLNEPSASTSNLFSDSLVVTHKGPLQSGKYKQREEHEMWMDKNTFVFFDRILQQLGLATRFFYEKNRYQGVLDGVLVTIDLLPEIGWFVEVEGHSEDMIKRILRILKLEGHKPIKDGYPKLLRSMAKDRKKEYRLSKQERIVRLKEQEG